MQSHLTLGKRLSLSLLWCYCLRTNLFLVLHGKNVSLNVTSINEQLRTSYVGSGDDDDPRLLVQFDAQPEDFATCWQELVNRMAGWIQKHIVK